MRIEEARWIGSMIELHVPESSMTGRTALNLGSGTAQSRTLNKPHIENLTIRPLKKKGLTVIHSDMFPADGVDLVGNLFDQKFQLKLAALHPEVVMFCNILEHLPSLEREKVPALIRHIVAPGGLVIVTVPHSYPYHPDPIDTLYRPNATELERLFSDYAVIESAVIDCGTYGDEFRRASLARQLRKIVRLLFPIVRPRRWLSHAHRMMWMRRPYQLTVALFRA